MSKKKSVKIERCIWKVVVFKAASRVEYITLKNKRNNVLEGNYNRKFGELKHLSSEKKKLKKIL